MHFYLRDYFKQNWEPLVAAKYAWLEDFQMHFLAKKSKGKRKKSLANYKNYTVDTYDTASISSNDLKKCMSSGLWLIVSAASTIWRAIIQRSNITPTSFQNRLQICKENKKSNDRDNSSFLYNNATDYPILCINAVILVQQFFGIISERNRPIRHDELQEINIIKIIRWYANK